MSRDYTEITDEQLRAINKRAVEQPSYEQLREQNRVLRLEFQSLLNVIDDSYDEDLPVEIVEARNKAQAALTATSQPAKPTGKMHACDIPGCVSCGNPEDATSQEGQG